MARRLLYTQRRPIQVCCSWMRVGNLVVFPEANFVLSVYLCCRIESDLPIFLKFLSKRGRQDQSYRGEGREGGERETFFLNCYNFANTAPFLKFFIRA